MNDDQKLKNDVNNILYAQKVFRTAFEEQQKILEAEKKEKREREQRENIQQQNIYKQMQQSLASNNINEDLIYEIRETFKTLYLLVFIALGIAVVALILSIILFYII